MKTAPEGLPSIAWINKRRAPAPRNKRLKEKQFPHTFNTCLIEAFTFYTVVRAYVVQHRQRCKTATAGGKQISHKLRQRGYTGSPSTEELQLLRRRLSVLYSLMGCRHWNDDGANFANRMYTRSQIVDRIHFLIDADMKQYAGNPDRRTGDGNGWDDTNAEEELLEGGGISTSAP